MCVCRSVVARLHAASDCVMSPAVLSVLGITSSQAKRPHTNTLAHVCCVFIRPVNRTTLVVSLKEGYILVAAHCDTHRNAVVFAFLFVRIQK